MTNVEKDIVRFDSLVYGDWVKQLANVYSRYAKGFAKTEISLDFAMPIEVEDIRPFHLVSLACLIQYLRNELGLRVSIRKNNNWVFDYIYNDLGFHEYWSGGKNHVKPKMTGSVFNLWRIVEEEKDLYAKNVENYLKSTYFHEKDLSAISVSLVEAYYNVFDHAKAQGNAFSIIQYDEPTSMLHVAISDFGIGIAQSVKDFNVDICKDYEAVLKAIEDNFTVGSTDRNRGMGLGNILAPTDDALLISHYGWVSKKGKNLTGYESDLWYPGTLVSYSVDLSKLDDEEFLEEFSF